MRELEASEWRCARCGAEVMSARPREGACGMPRTLGARACAWLFTAETRPRSGLAYAAGFVGIVYLFRLSAAALAWEWLGVSAEAVGLLWSAAGPAAMVLGLAAARDLERAPWRVGKAQALVGYLLGFWGTLWLVREYLFRP